MRIHCWLLALLSFNLSVAWVRADQGVEGQPTPLGLDTHSLTPGWKVDLRPELERWGLGPRQQGERPTCSAFTMAGALEFAAAKRHGHGTRFSVEFLNWAANQAAGDRFDGGFFSDLWKGFGNYGICPEEEMPYQAKFSADAQPSAGALTQAKTRLALGLRLHWIKEWDVRTGLTEEHLAAIRHTLEAGWPVCGGLRWPKQERWDNDVLVMCPPDAVRDGHSVLLVGFRDDATQPGGGLFLFRNTSGNGHDGAMPYAYAQAYMNDAVWVDYQARHSHREGDFLVVESTGPESWTYRWQGLDARR